MPQKNQLKERLLAQSIPVEAQPAFQSVLAQFADQCSQTPSAIALVGLNQTFTYRQLNQRVNQLAHFL